MVISIGIIFALISMISYGLADSIARVPAKKLGSQQTLFFRNIIISLSLLVILLFNLDEANFNLAYMGIALGISLIGYIPVIAFFEAIKRGKIGVLSPISRSSVLVTIILSLVFFKESLSGVQLLSIAGILFGVILISVNFKDFKNSQFFKISSGVPLALVAMIGWGLVFFLFKIPVNVLGPVLTAFLVELGLVFYSGAYIKSNKLSFKIKDKKQWKYLLFAGICGAAGTLFYNLGINAASVSIVASITGCVPLVATIYARLVYKEKLSTIQYFAGIIMVVSVVAVSYFG